MNSFRFGHVKLCEGSFQVSQGINEQTAFT